LQCGRNNVQCGAPMHAVHVALRCNTVCCNATCGTFDGLPPCAEDSVVGGAIAAAPSKPNQASWSRCRCDGGTPRLCADLAGASPLRRGADVTRVGPDSDMAHPQRRCWARAMRARCHRSSSGTSVRLHDSSTSLIRSQPLQCATRCPRACSSCSTRGRHKIGTAYRARHYA
jgi:hypothetical protein